MLCIRPAVCIDTVYMQCTVLLRRKFTPPSGPEIAKAAEICNLLVYLLGDKPTTTLYLTLNCKPDSKNSEKVTHR